MRNDPCNKTKLRMGVFIYQNLRLLRILILLMFRDKIMFYVIYLSNDVTNNYRDGDQIKCKC